jgi:putative ABC transport system permease protein
MNLAVRDIRHNLPRFALTCLGLGMLLGTVVVMVGIYRGALDDALALPRASSPDLWVVQPRTMGPFAEPSRIPRDTRQLIRRMPGVAAAGAVTFQQVQVTVKGKPVRLYLQGYEPGRPGGPRNLIAGHPITESHYQLVADVSSGLRVGDQVPIGPYHDLYTVVGLTRGMVTSSGDPVGWVTLLDAQAIQFAVPPALQRREKAAGRKPPETADINAVLVQLHPGVSEADVAQDIERWKHLSAVTQQQEEDYLTRFVISRQSKQLGMFMAILVAVAAVIITLIIYTLTMDKLRSIATLKLVGAPDRTIIGLVVQEALLLGIGGFALGLALVLGLKDYLFVRRVLVEPGDLAMVFAIVVAVCLLGSALSVRVAVKVDPAKALASG